MTDAPSPALMPLTEADLDYLEACALDPYSTFSREMTLRAIAMARRAEPQHASKTPRHPAEAAADFWRTETDKLQAMLEKTRVELAHVERCFGMEVRKNAADTAAAYARGAAEMKEAAKITVAAEPEYPTAVNAISDDMLGKMVANPKAALQASVALTKRCIINALDALPTPRAPGLDDALEDARAEEREVTFTLPGNMSFASAASCFDLTEQDLRAKGYETSADLHGTVAVAIRARADEREGT